MDNVRLSPRGEWIGVLAGAGATAAIAGLVLTPVTTWAHVLLLGTFAVQIGLAGAFLIALQFLTGAGWSVALRRVPEAMTALIPAGGAVVLAAQLLCPELYPWMSPDYHAHGAFKHVWLSKPFFYARTVAYVVIWTALARAMVNASRRQDAERAPGPTRRLTVLSAVFAVVFAVTSTLAAFDWVMSREPEWVSTIFGVYLFAGIFTIGLALVGIIAAWLEREGPWRGVYSEAHRHDLGKLLFGMSSFWMYAWYSQYMLIWYVNFPEETAHYVTRQAGALRPLFWLNVVLNWGVPFLALLPRAWKVNRKVLVNVGVVVLAGHGLDLFLAILPPTLPRWEDIVLPAAMSVGAIAAAWAVIRWALGRAGAVPVGDPCLVESLPHAAPAGAGGEHA
jgi:hypothetical protein